MHLKDQDPSWCRPGSLDIKKTGHLYIALAWTQSILGWSPFIMTRYERTDQSFDNRQ